MLKLKNSFYIILIPLIFILFPRPSIGQLPFMVYPALLSVATFMIFYFLNKNLVPKYVISIVIFLILLLTTQLLSTVNSGNSSIGLIFMIMLKYLLFIGIFTYASTVAYNSSFEEIKNGLLKIAYISVIFQIIFGVIQLLDIKVFTYLYSMNKTLPFGGLTRIAGTLANPNIFAWIVIQMIVIIYLFETNKLKKITFVLVGLTLVILSGSRSSLLWIVLIITFVELMKARKNIGFFFYKVTSYSYFTD